MRKPLFKPKIVLLANNKVGYEIAKYLKKSDENIVALIIHKGEEAKYTDEIMSVFKTVPILYDDEIRNELCLKKIFVKISLSEMIDFKS